MNDNDGPEMPMPSWSAIAATLRGSKNDSTRLQLSPRVPLQSFLDNRECRIANFSDVEAPAMLTRMLSPREYCNQGKVRRTLLLVVLTCGCILTAITWIWLYFSSLYGSLEPLAKLEHPQTVLALAFSPDGTTLASGGRDLWSGSLKLWDAKTYQERCTLPNAQWITAVAFSPDSALLAAGCGRFNDAGDPKAWGYRAITGEILIYELASMRLLTTLTHKYGVFAVAFSPDGTLLATAGGNEGGTVEVAAEAEVNLWDVKSWKKKVSLEGLQGRIVGLAFSPEGSPSKVS